MNTPSENLAAILADYPGPDSGPVMYAYATPEGTASDPTSTLTVGDLRAIAADLEAAAKFRAEVELLVADTRTYVDRINPTTQYREGRKDGASAVLARVERLVVTEIAPGCPVVHGGEEWSAVCGAS